MPSTRTYRSIFHILNTAPVAMSSFAAASRIPALRPIAIACCIPRPVNSLLVARQYIPTAQRARPSTSIASLASSLAAMAISKPVNQAIALPSASKPTSSLPFVAAPCSKLAADRIQARRQRVIANLQAPKKRPTAPGSSRAVSPPTKTLVSILKSKDKKKPRVIPLPPANAPPSTVVSAWMGPTSPEPTLKPRGDRPYCECRPCSLDPNGNRRRTDYGPLDYFGIKCTCHPAGGIIPTQYWIRPCEWGTTPAEADVDPTRPRIVRFTDDPVRSTVDVDRWWTTVWPYFEISQDGTTEAEDDAAIHAMDNPPTSSEFQSNMRVMMDQYFPNDDDDPPAASSDFKTSMRAMMDQYFPDDDE